MVDSESFKDELRKLCMELDLDVGEYSEPSPIGTISCLRGCEVYRYYLKKIGMDNSEFVEEVEKYEREYDENKKRVVYKTSETGDE